MRRKDNQADHTLYKLHLPRRVHHLTGLAQCETVRSVASAKIGTGAMEYPL